MGDVRLTGIAPPIGSLGSTTRHVNPNPRTREFFVSLWVRFILHRKTFTTPIDVDLNLLMDTP